MSITKLNYACVYVFVLHPLLFSYRGNRTRALNSEGKHDRADFTDWMSFLLPNSMEDSALIQKPFVKIQLKFTPPLYCPILQ